MPANKPTPVSDLLSNQFFSILPMALGSALGLVLSALESVVYYLIYLMFLTFGNWKG